MLKRLTGSYSKNEQEHAKAKITAKHQNCLNITTLFPQIIFSNHHPCRSFQPVTVLNYPRLSFCVWQRNHFLGHTLRFTCKLRLFNLDGGGLQPHHLSSVIGTLPFRKEKHEIKFQNWKRCQRNHSSHAGNRIASMTGYMRIYEAELCHLCHIF